MFDQLRCVLQGNAANHRNRQVDPGTHLSDQVQRHGRGAGFGQGVEEPAKCHVRRAVSLGLLGQFHAAMTSSPDNRLVPEQGAGIGQRAVGLPQVHAHPQPRSQFSVIVDDQPGLVAFAELEQFGRFAQTAGLVTVLVAVLQQRHAAVQCRFDVRQKFSGQQLAVGDGIQATQFHESTLMAMCYEQKSSGSRRGTNCPRPNCSASLSVRQV